MIGTRTIFTYSSCNDLCLMDGDGQTLISGHLDNNIRFWDTRTGSDIRELTDVHIGQVTSVSMSPGNNDYPILYECVLRNIRWSMSAN